MLLMEQELPRVGVEWEKPTVEEKDSVLLKAPKLLQGEEGRRRTSQTGQQLLRIGETPLHG
jgi:hypothetical protein